jgi:hypothetical protein
VSFVGLQSLSQIFVERLLNSAVEGVLIAGLVCLLLRVLGRQNSGTRFAIWFAALLSIVVLPFVGASRFAAAHALALPLFSAYRGIILSDTWAFYFFVAWGIGTSALLLRLGVGLWRLGRLRRKCDEVDVSSLDPAIAKIMLDLGMSRRVKLCVSNDVTLPAAIGLFQPAIVFPPQLLAQLSTEETKVILLHELAHLRRRDDWTNLVQKIVKAVFFFHPAVSWIENRLSLEREKACDDTVLAQAASPKVYASSLISFAEKLHSARSLALAQALVSRMHQMSARVSHILDAKRSRSMGLSKPVLGLCAGMLALVFVAAPYAPRFVAFEAPASGVRQTANAESPIGDGIAPSSDAMAHETRGLNSQVQARVIPAAFVQRAAQIHKKFDARSPRRPAAIHASAAQPATPQTVAWHDELPIRATFVILRTTQYDASGPQIWTFCVWKVTTENQYKEFQSEIFVGVI